MNKISKLSLKLLLEKSIESNWAPAHGMARGILPWWNASVGSNLGPNVGTAVLKTEPERPQGLMRGAILYLARSRQSDITQLIRSLRLLRRNFLSRFPYPVIIFHEEIGKSDQAKIENACQVNVEFVQLRFHRPDWMSPGEEVGLEWRIGYCHMCKWFADDIFEHPRLAELDWYMRLDVDSYILAPINYDPFRFLERESKIYGYLTTFYEESRVVEGLGAAVARYLSKQGINPTFLNKFVNRDGFWNLTSFYTNFEVTKLEFWRSANCRSFINFINSERGIYLKRWGDAPLHFLSLALFASEGQIARLEGIGYRHVDYFSVP